MQIMTRSPSSTEAGSKPKQYRCEMCSKSFDSMIL